MAPEEFRAARKALGLSQHAMADALNMGRHGWQSVSRWEKEGNTVPGPVAVAVRYMVEHGPVFHGRNV